MSGLHFMQSPWLDSWFTLEGVPDFGTPEGTAEEWRAIAAAIRRGEDERFKRCAAYRVGDGWCFVSPRNTTRKLRHPDVNQAEALELADRIEEVIREAEASS